MIDRPERPSSSVRPEPIPLKRIPRVRWRVEFVSGRLVQPPTDLSELIAAGRRMLLERGWHLAVCVTDLPLQTARRPVIAHVSATHGVAVLSMPALGPVSVRKRTAETTVRLAGHILGDLAQAEGAAGRLPLAEARPRRGATRTLGMERGEHGVGFVAQVITGNIARLLLGMLRANRPWRLALRLMRVLAVAFAAGVFALVTSDIWRLAHYLGPLRLVAIGLGSVAAITVTIMVSTGLWERSPHPAAAYMRITPEISWSWNLDGRPYGGGDALQSGPRRTVHRREP